MNLIILIINKILKNFLTIFSFILNIIGVYLKYKQKKNTYKTSNTKIIIIVEIDIW